MSNILSDGTKNSVSYAPKALSKADRNFSHIKKEALTIIHTVKVIHQYLYGRHYIMLTDYKPLLRLSTEDKAIQSMASARIQRWAITLSACNFFSRYLLENTNQESSQLANQILLTELLHSPVNSKEINYSSQHDSVIYKVIEYVITGWLDSAREQLKPYYYLRNELSVENLCLLWGNRVFKSINF